MLGCLSCRNNVYILPSGQLKGYIWQNMPSYYGVFIYTVFLREYRVVTRSLFLVIWINNQTLLFCQTIKVIDEKVDFMLKRGCVIEQT